MKKYIFLDIDYVLNSEQWYKFYWKNQYHYTNPKVDYDLDFRAIVRLNYLVSHTGAEIVISSSWRFDMEDTVTRLMRSGLKYKPTKRIEGIEFGGNDDTPTRGDLINNFLKENPCDNYLILDDDSDIEENQLSHFIKTDRWLGLTKEDVYKGIEILNN